ncbi:MAG: sulfatase-like hydrolase/transferase [Verrucomicrobia bacterium]|nr:sulfatase-like hydrolase/transferase [Verrucomicrobiota bacterium]MCH8513132.1 sulfatase-like hydrolase/transferase [Kiritimatiellia bacterium]
MSFTSERPNFLLILTDQHFAEMIGSLQPGSGLRTPHLDRLRQRGVCFESAYATHALCVPSRSSIFTGRYPHEIGVDFNQNPTPNRIRVPMLGRCLSDAGYECGLAGKWQLAVPTEEAEVHGFSFLHQGKDTEVLSGCRDFWDQLKEDRPFCLVAAYDNPHDICEFARMEGGIEDRLPNGEIGMPPENADELPPLRANHAEAADEPPALKKWKTNPWELPWLTRIYPAAAYTEINWRRYLWAYHRLVEKVDAAIGQLLAELDARGLTDNTIILFSSDHGDGLGSHKWTQKIAFYEEVSRVPFWLCGPGIPAGASREGPISIGLDILPTVLEYAGVQNPADLPGRSVKALVEESVGAPWRDHVVLEAEFGGWGPQQQTGIQGRCVRGTTYKYICYFDPEAPGEAANEQLFHLPTDPGETRNLLQEPVHRAALERHRALLSAHLQSSGDRRWRATVSKVV